MKRILLASVLVSMSAFCDQGKPEDYGSEKGKSNTRPFISCTTDIFPVWTVTGNKCSFRDEAMVGIQSLDPMVIRCGRINVRCNSSPEKSEPRQEE